MPRVIVKAVFEDIKFQCQRCGSCCHHKRPLDFDDLVPMEQMKEFWEKSNLIYLTEKDVTAISKKTGKKPNDIVDTLYDYDGCYVKVKDNGRQVILDLPVMKSKEDTTCIFYREGCTIYSVRPIACRLFPFRVEEETLSNGDILLRIQLQSHLPGHGKGKESGQEEAGEAGGRSVPAKDRGHNTSCSEAEGFRGDLRKGQDIQNSAGKKSQ